MRDHVERLPEPGHDPGVATSDEHARERSPRPPPPAQRQLGNQQVHMNIINH